MIADCETCDRKQVPCKSCQESQRAICFVCQGGEVDPYRETVTDWEDVEQLTNVIPWCDACQGNHWPSQCDPDSDQQRMPR